MQEKVDLIEVHLQKLLEEYVQPGRIAKKRIEEDTEVQNFKEEKEFDGDTVVEEE